MADNLIVTLPSVVCDGKSGFQTNYPIAGAFTVGMPDDDDSLVIAKLEGLRMMRLFHQQRGFEAK